VSLPLTPAVLRQQNICSSYVLLLLRATRAPDGTASPLEGKLLYQILYDGQAKFARLLRPGDSFFVFRPCCQCNVGEALFDPKQPEPETQPAAVKEVEAREAGGGIAGGGARGRGMRHVVQREREAVSPFVTDCSEEFADADAGTDTDSRFLSFHLEVGSATVLFRLSNVGFLCSSSEDPGGQRKRKLGAESAVVAAGAPPAVGSPGNSQLVSGRRARFATVAAKYGVEVAETQSEADVPRFLDMSGASRLVLFEDLCSGMTGLTLVLRVLAVAPVENDGVAVSEQLPPRVASHFEVYGQVRDPASPHPSTDTNINPSSAARLVCVLVPAELLLQQKQIGSDCHCALEAGNTVALCGLRVQELETRDAGRLPAALHRLLLTGAPCCLVRRCVLRASSAVDAASSAASEGQHLSGTGQQQTVLNFSYLAALVTSCSMVDQLTTQLYRPTHDLGTGPWTAESSFILTACVETVRLMPFGRAVTLFRPMKDEGQVARHAEALAWALPRDRKRTLQLPGFRRSFMIIRPLLTAAPEVATVLDAPGQKASAALKFGRRMLCYYQQRVSDEAGGDIHTAAAGVAGTAAPHGAEATEADTESALTAAAAAAELRPRLCYTQFVSAGRLAVGLRCKVLLSRVDDLCEMPLRLSAGCASCGHVTMYSGCQQSGPTDWSCQPCGGCGGLCAVHEGDFSELYRLEVIGQPMLPSLQ
jgi:hypothetical protein